MKFVLILTPVNVILSDLNIFKVSLLQKKTQKKMKLHELFPSSAVKIPSPRENISKITIPEVQQGRYNHNR